MPFGLINGPAIFQSLISGILQDVKQFNGRQERKHRLAIVQISPESKSYW